ncbi:MAG: bifunctional aspartate kinase/homoserine dehydrogenase I [Bacteriovoracaceae bacterium]|nr:bifunctional aspartate kinase/homoserine dehydrogenase I [Bacteriovoracaceae bacterium]
MDWIVYKFGGSSLKDADCFRAVSKNIQKSQLKLSANTNNTKMAVVLSAMEGVTDLLISSLDMAAQSDEGYKQIIEQIKGQHLDTFNQLVDDQNICDKFGQQLESDILELQHILRASQLSRSYSDTALDLVSGQGEIWSTIIMNLYLQSQKAKSIQLNARDILFVESLPTGPLVDWETSGQKLDKYLKSIDDCNNIDIVIITGYIATTAQGIPTSLKRNGSDYTASIFASLLDAKSIHIFSNVDGIYSADPRRVSEAVLINEVSYNEAIELAYFGAKVLHPNTMIPAMTKNIPIHLHNTFRPDAPGTLIQHHSHKKPHFKSAHQVQGVASIDSIALINLEGAGMIGVPGISERLFGVLKSNNISVIMISQGSSEYSICFAVHEKDSKKAQKVVEHAFAQEKDEGHIHSVKLISSCSILACVGDNMANNPGIAATFCNALKRAHINIMAIAQGSSERNISLVIAKKDITKGLRAVHSAFYLSNQTISIGIVGVGLIGSTLLKQLEDQKVSLKENFNIDLRIRGLSNSKKMLLMEPISLSSWEEDFKTRGVPADLKQFVDHLQTDHLPHSVIIDCTSSGKVVESYIPWLQKGIHIIAPNKKANSSSLESYKNIFKTLNQCTDHHCSSKSTHYFYETTVGAGLPVISTLKDILMTGDRIIEIEGVLSGTLSYIFNKLSDGHKFSTIVKEAKELGYTEPDPREDLSGLDVTRKIVILAREMGLDVKVEDIPTENLVPSELASIEDIDEFLEALKEYDVDMDTPIKKAQENNNVLRYVGCIKSDGTCDVSLKAYPKEHPFSHLRGSENIIAFKTKRYNEYPLIIQGPGAGAEVTAAGVFADLLRLADLLGGSS